MNIGNINSVRGPEEVSSVRSAPLRPLAPLGSAPLPNDSVRVNGASSTQSETTGKPLSQCREEFKTNLNELKGQSDDDKAAIRDIGSIVNERTDLNSKEKEWLFATEMGVYTADAAMTMTSLQTKGQPVTAQQQSRLKALTGTYAAAKGLAEAVEPMVAKPDTQPPSFEAAGPGQPIKASTTPLQPAPLQPAPPVGVPTQPAPLAGANAPVDPNAPPANTPPAPPKDPLVAIWESRRQEAQDTFNDYKAMMQKISDWKARIIASRIAFFWKVYGAHTNFLCDGWKR